jgi:hypothetical protein
VILDLLGDPLIGDADYRLQMIGVPPVTQHHPAVGAVPAELQADMLTLGFLQAHGFT